MPEELDQPVANAHCHHQRMDGNTSVIKLEVTDDGQVWRMCLRCNQKWHTEHWNRPCAWCETKTYQHIAHVSDWRPGYALCDLCLKCHGAGMSLDSVWQQSGYRGGTGYYRRSKQVAGTTQSWEFRKWSTEFTKRSDAVKWIQEQSKTGQYEYAMVQCSECHRFHNGMSTWAGDRCGECAKMKCSKCSKYTANYTLMPSGAAMCEACQSNLIAESVKVANKTMQTPVKKGDVARIPKASSPMFTEQWSCVGSAKTPYIISRKNHADGSTDDERFCCSCMAFTRNTPREPCKHILKVKLFEGMSLAAKAGTVVPTSHAKEYAEFLALKAQKARIGLAEGEIKMVGDNTGRKFR